MRLAVITINYNSSESTVRLLKSLAVQTDKDFQIIVIDNASIEGDFDNLKAECPSFDGIHLVKNDANLGFSGGNNLGIKMALNPSSGGGAEWVLLLNNDTWVEGGFIASLKLNLAHLGGIVGIPLDEGRGVAYYGFVEWIRATLRHSYEPPKSGQADIYAIGGAMVIHKDVFEKIGFLDEKYFLYFEDADFSIRAKEAGFKLTILEDLKVSHQVSSSTKKLGSPLLLRYHYRNALYFNWKHAPSHMKILAWGWSFLIIKKQLIKIMAFYRREESIAILRGVIDFYKNRMGKIK